MLYSGTETSGIGLSVADHGHIAHDAFCVWRVDVRGAHAEDEWIVCIDDAHVVSHTHVETALMCYDHILREIVRHYVGALVMLQHL